MQDATAEINCALFRNVNEIRGPSINNVTLFGGEERGGRPSK